MGKPICRWSRGQQKPCVADQQQPLFSVCDAHKNNTTQVTPFNFNQHQIRVVTIDGKPWFVAADVLHVLTIKNVTHALRPLSADEVRPLPFGLIKGKGMSQAKLISESGLYKLVLRSDKPEAKAFQDWVTRHVLPAINRDGMYVRGEEKVLTGEMSDDELILRAHEALQRKVTRLQDENRVLTQQRDELAPKAAIVEETYAEGRKNLLTVREFCRRFDGVNLIQLAGRSAGSAYRAP